jgi:hypothetical protein
LTNGPIVKDKRYSIVLIVVYALSKLLLWLINYVATSIQHAQSPDSLCFFPLYQSLHRGMVIECTILLIVHSMLAAAYYIGTMRAKWVARTLLCIWLSASISILIYYTNFGYLEETGISYQSTLPYYNAEKIPWSQMDRFAQLDVDYFQGRGGLVGGNVSGYIFRITLKSKQEQTFKISLSPKSLSRLLRTLQQNQIHVTTHFNRWGKTFAMISSDPNMLEVLNDIKLLTEIK